MELAELSTSQMMDAMRDEVAAMQHQETSFYHSSALEKPNAKHPYRIYMVQWMQSIHDTFQLCPVVVPTAMHYLDCISCHAPLDYQLCGLTALHLAVKVHETRIFQLKQLLELGNVCFTEENVLQTERRILKACQFRLHPPVAEAFLYTLGRLFDATPHITSTAFSVLRQSVAMNLSMKPSVVAYASLLTAMEQSFISVEQKQDLCVKIMQVSGLTAASPGLADAYKYLAAAQQRCTSPIVATTYATAPAPAPVVQQQQHQQQPVQIQQHQPSQHPPQQVYPVHAPPMVVQQEPTEATDLSKLLSPESHDEGEYREVILCAEDGIEVTFCGKPGLDVLDSISPRNVEDV